MRPRCRRRSRGLDGRRGRRFSGARRRRFFHRRQDAVDLGGDALSQIVATTQCPEQVEGVIPILIVP
jgi:hypothetical protein